MPLERSSDADRQSSVLMVVLVVVGVLTAVMVILVAEL